MSAIRVTMAVWASKRKKVQPAALRVHIGSAEATKRRTLAEWDALYEKLLRTPIK